MRIIRTLLFFILAIGVIRGKIIMSDRIRKFGKILILIITLQISVFAQTKFDEYKNIGTDHETGRLDSFLIQLRNKPEAKGLLIVYSGENGDRLGNLIPYLEGIKQYLKLRDFDNERVSTVIAKGQEMYKRELWIIEKDEQMPGFQRETYDLSGLDKNYLYAVDCVVCEPSEPLLSTDRVDWSLLGKTLKENPGYKVFLSIGKNSVHYDYEKKKNVSAKEYAEDLRRRLSENYKIDKNRFSYEIIDEGFNAEIYIIPNSE